ncbi:hypothetical protein FAGKG844_90038 [Frankia sp. AgKG'84/4]
MSPRAYPTHPTESRSAHVQEMDAATAFHGIGPSDAGVRLDQVRTQAGHPRGGSTPAGPGEGQQRGTRRRIQRP